MNDQDIKPLREKEIAAAEEKMRLWMREDAAVDVRENGVMLPFLSVYIANRSTSLLANGQEPHDGWFFYGPTQEEFEHPICHIFHISRGFRQMSKGDKDEMKVRYEHLVSGIVVADTPKPFFIHIAGSHRLEKLWDFRNDLRKINARGTPTFSMSIRLSTEKIMFKNDGQDRVAKVVNFEISRDTSGNLEVINDPESYIELRERSREMKQYEEQYISRVEVDKEGNRVLASADVDETVPDSSEKPSMIASQSQEPAKAIVEEQPLPIPPEKEENVNPDDIPF